MSTHKTQTLQTLVPVMVLVLVVCVAGTSTTRTTSPGTQTRTLSKELLEQAPPEFARQFLPRHPTPNYVPKSQGHYSRADWQAAIDSTWGPGLTTAEKMTIFFNFWNRIDDYFACFNGLDSNVWDSVWNLYFPEIVDTVSRGRFSAILVHSCMSLRELHTKAYDRRSL